MSATSNLDQQDRVRDHLAWRAPRSGISIGLVTSALATSALVTSALATSALGCSLSTFENSSCETNTECRGAFGYGWSCNGDGFCQEAEPHPRCNAGYPNDLIGNLEEYQDRLVLGAIMDRSTPSQEARIRSARLAALQVNEMGGIDGRQIGLVMCTNEENSYYDDLAIADAGASVATYLSDTLGVPAIIGPSGSTNATTAFTSVQQFGTLVISPSATADSLSNLEHQDVSDDHPGLLWRTAPPDSFQGGVIVADMLNRGIQQVAVIHEADDPFAEGLANRINSDLVAEGSSVTLHPWGTEGERAERITTVAGTTAQEVVFIASNKVDNVAFLLGASSNAGYDAKTFFLPDSAASEDVFADAVTANGIFSRIRGTRPAPLDGAFSYETFVASYLAEYNEDVTQLSWTAQTYDAAWLVFYGSAWSQFRTGEVAGKGIGWGLRKISCLSDGWTQPCNQTPLDVIASNWTAVVEQFRVGTAVDIVGASGDLNYDLVTEETSAAIQVWVVDTNGTITAAP